MYFLEEPYVSIRSFFEAGGNVLWGIFVVTMLMWALIIERMWFFRANMPHIFRAAIREWEERADKTSWYALRIREQLVVPPSAQIAVIGPGRLGLLVGMVLNLAGTEVVMIGRRASSLELPRRLNMQTAFSADLADSSFDTVVEVTGNRGGLIEAMRLVRPLGTIVMKSTYTELSDIDLTKIVVGELTVVGSRCGPFVPALRLLARKEVDIEPLVDAEYALRDGPAAMARAAEPGVRKILMRP